MNLKVTIEELIATNREGDYWDFKSEHHRNKASLLHDILCLANTVTKCDKYIIFGISDPLDGCQLKGLLDDNRKTQSQIIDFLRSKDFAAENRPEVELTKIEIQGIEIDILKIVDRPDKPYYLSSTYTHDGKHVNKFHIYVRNLDTNTPLTENADPRRIELMWRERMGLDVKPAEKMEIFLRDAGNWEKDIGNSNLAYYKYQPEYNVVFSAPEYHDDSYAYYFSNHKSFFGKMSFNYLNVELFEIDYIYYDEMRLIISAPETGVFLIGDDSLCYNYYTRDTRSWNALCFLSTGTCSLESRSRQAPIIVFDDLSEKEKFEKYVNDNLQVLDNPLIQETSKFLVNQIGYAQKNWNVDPSEAVTIWSVYMSWVNEQA